MKITLFIGIIYITLRDLKPDNIVFEKKNPNSTIKIIDFGRSKIFSPKEGLNELTGTVFKKSL